MPTDSVIWEMVPQIDRSSDRKQPDREKYIPGACNIGAAEIARRKRSGRIGIALTIALWAIFILLDVPPAWRLTLFFPAAIAAMGFLQAYMHFCAYFGFASLFNFDDVGKTDSVAQAKYRAHDRRKAWQIVVSAVVLGAVVAYLGYVV